MAIRAMPVTGLNKTIEALPGFFLVPLSSVELWFLTGEEFEPWFYELSNWRRKPDDGHFKCRMLLEQGTSWFFFFFFTVANCKKKNEKSGLFVGVFL